jgi:iron complex outermembrane receptor protein
VDEETLRRFNRDDLAEALDLMPGVALSRTGARNERTIHVRGLDLKHVPLFLTYSHLCDVRRLFRSGRFTTFDTSQIVLSKGAASVLYGFNTMGGAINVITKRPDKPFETNGGIGMAEETPQQPMPISGPDRATGIFKGAPAM